MYRTIIKLLNPDFKKIKYQAQRERERERERVNKWYYLLDINVTTTHLICIYDSLSNYHKND